jgi:AraC-like DNA-binding protein
VSLVIINAVAIVNLLLVIVVLLVRSSHAGTKADKVLAWILVNPIFSMLFLILLYCKQAVNYPIIFYITYLVDLSWAPLFYYFVHLLLHKKIKTGIHTLYHFSFFIAGCVFFIWFSFQPDEYRHQIYLQAQTEDYPWQLSMLDYLTVLQVAVYLYISNTLIRKYNRHIKEVFSNINSISGWWTNKFIPSFSLLSAFTYCPLLITNNLVLPMITLPVAALIMYYYLTYKVITSPLVFSKETLRIIEQTEEVVSPVKANVFYSDISHDLDIKLEELLHEQKIFLDSDLNIQTLAERCNTRVHILSTFINKHYNKTFFDYINSYRIEEAKMLLASPEQQRYSINAIAEKAGFRSRSAFYKAFKKGADATPSEFTKNAVDRS